MLKALRISPDSYHVYQTLASLGGFEPSSLQVLNNQFVVIGTGRRRVEYYDEKDFRKEFEWIEKPVKDNKPLYKFLPVQRIKNEENE